MLQPTQMSWKALASMCCPLAPEGYCGGLWHCAGQMATRQSGLPWASKHEHAGIAYARSPRGREWLAQQCHFGSVYLRHKS